MQIFIERESFLAAVKTAQQLEQKNESELFKKGYKLVINMLYILQRHGLYPVFNWLCERIDVKKANSSDIRTLLAELSMQALNGFILHGGLSSVLLEISSSPAETSAQQIFDPAVTPKDLHAMRQVYGRTFLIDTPAADVCVQFLRSYLIHLKNELNAAIRSKVKPPKNSSSAGQVS